VAPPTGCPLDYDWCYYTPKIQFWQYILGVILLVTGYSISNVMTFVIYSKLLGPWPQGKAMGILTSVGSSARAVGPICVSSLCSGYGPRVSIIFLTGVLIVSIVIIFFAFKRYVPYNIKRNEIV
jgi:MFS transporter, ceroid-lipofuscinosis neuronal protein 7